MKYVKGFTWGWYCSKEEYASADAKKSMRLMKERTAIDTVVLPIRAYQDTFTSTVVTFQGPEHIEDKDLKEMIRYAKEDLGLRVFLKPTVDCRDNTWRARISFFDVDVHCEPKWCDWFESYTKYQVHYAKIAEETGCELFVVGCEMVQAAKRTDEWIAVVKEVRKHFSGLVTYNCDKYQEDNVAWWDHLDVICASGYYPIDQWDAQLDRIEKFVKKYNKPYFFAEAGIPSRVGSAMNPNDWSFESTPSQEEQEMYYKEMFAKVSQRDWHNGYLLWDWRSILPNEEEAHMDKDYGVFGKLAEKVVFDYYSNK